MKFIPIMAVAAVAIVTVATTPAEARRAKKQTVDSDYTALLPEERMLAYANDGFRLDVPVTGERKRYTKHRVPKAQKTASAPAYSRPCGSVLSLDCIVAPELVHKTKEIIADCGSKVVSARAPRGNKSNHPIGRAVDLVGNPGCIYAHLKDWPGGYSIDYGRVHHVHISYNPGGQEWGLRFAHGGGHKHYAARRHTRYAAKQ